MEIDVNEPRSRAFCLFLRWVHLSLGLAVVQWVTELLEPDCIDDTFRTVQILVWVELAMSVAGLAIVKCREDWGGRVLLVWGFIQVVLFAGLAVMIWQEYGWQQFCSSSNVVMWYLLMQLLQAGVMTLFVLILPFFWVQRYSNSPGNIAWFLTFYSFTWHANVEEKMLFVGFFLFLVSFLTLVLNLIAACRGVTACIRRWLLGVWVVGLLLLGGAEALAATAVGDASSDHTFTGQLARTLLKIFLAGNALDMIFWIFGLFTLSRENGDPVRDDILVFGRDPALQQEEPHDRSDEPQQHNQFGTLA